MFTKRELQLLRESVNQYSFSLQSSHLASELSALKKKLESEIADITVFNGVEYHGVTSSIDEIIGNFMAGRSNSLDGVDGLHTVNLNLMPLLLKKDDPDDGNSGAPAMLHVGDLHAGFKAIVYEHPRGEVYVQ